MAKTRTEDKKNKPSSEATDTASYSQTTRQVCNTNIEQKNGSVKKKRNWACVVYPESLPKDWLEILRKTGLKIAISPLHDKDFEADGQTIKKSHYHVILVYSGPTSFAVVKGLTNILHAPNPIPLEAVRGYHRYFTHKDNPEKYQYDEKDIQYLNGFSIIDFEALTKGEVLDITFNMVALIREKNFLEYADFVEYAQDNLTREEFLTVTNHTIFFRGYISSRRHRKTKPNVSDIAKQATGNDKEDFDIF